MISYRQKRRLYWSLAHRWSVIRLRREVIYTAFFCIMIITVISLLRTPQLYLVTVRVHLDHLPSPGIY